MPIPVMTVLPPPPPARPPAPIDPQILRTLGRVVATWTSPDGDELLLSDCSTGVDWLAGREGEDMPPFEILEDANLDVEGSTIRGVRALPRRMGLPILLHRDTYGEWRSVQQRLARAFDPTRGDGVLSYAQPDGKRRHLTARYSAGMEGVDIRSPRGLWYRIYPLSIRAVDPYPYDPDPVSIGPFKAVTPSAGFLDPPFLPLKLRGSTAIGEVTVDNTGDALSFPTLRFVPPYTGITATNHTTGLSLVLDTTAVAGGSPLIIDHRPGRQSIRLEDGTNMWATRVGTPSLWPLERGKNAIEFAVTGVGPESVVEGSYTRRFLTL